MAGSLGLPVNRERFQMTRLILIVLVPTLPFVQFCRSLTLTPWEVPAMSTSTVVPAVEQIPLDRIVPSPYQTRKNFDPEKLQELAATLKEHGLLNAINVRPVGDKFEL